MKGQDQFLLISTPRSGSDWFAGCLGWTHPTYHREFFNPTCNLHCEGWLRQVFGSEVDWQNIAVSWECQSELIEYVFAITWTALKPTFGLRYAKENYSAFKIGFFHRHFDCFALVGHRAFTFPGGSKPRDTMFWWSRYYESLALNRDLLEPDVAGLVDRCQGSPVDLAGRACAAQVIATYQTVKECTRLGIPILEYRRLATLRDADAVAEYLADKVPTALLSAEVAARVAATNRAPDKSRAYEALGAEGLCRDLIAMMPEPSRAYF